MAKAWDWEVFQPLAADYSSHLVRLSGDSLALFLCTQELTEIERWSFGELELDASQQDDIEALTAKAYTELMTNPLLGTIFPYVTASVPTGALACDGASYLRVDYPDLYAALDSAFIVDADDFIVPDLQGRTLIGVGAGSGLTARAVNDAGGEESHTLVTAELASHAHGVTDPTHTHLEGIAVPIAILVGVGAPVPSAIPGAGVTGASATGISINSTGNDTAHENMQPFTALGYAIWAT